jgi:hypothetical protein
MVLGNQLSFFFGAGASAGFSIPTMKELTAEFTREVDQQAHENEKAIYHDIVESMKSANGGLLDIEAIFSVIEFLKEYNIKKLGEPAIYMLSKRLGLDDTALSTILPESLKLESTAQSREQVGRSALVDLEKRFQKFIIQRCRIPPNKREHVERVYRSFFKKMGDFGGSFLGGGDVRFGADWRMFTTNYDTCIEDFWRDNADIRLSTGFDNGIMNSDKFLGAHYSNANLPLLTKLHGSRNWLINKRTKNIEEKDFDMEQASEIGYHGKFEREVMIYPLQQKQLYVEPYLQMFYCLNKDLERKIAWLVIGYSFRDDVISNIFRRNLERSKSKYLIIVHPEANRIAKEHFSGYEHIVPRELYFGKEDSYESTNAVIKETLQDI